MRETSQAANSRRSRVTHACSPRLTDYGLSVERTPLGYWNITSDRMLLEPAGRAGDSRSDRTPRCSELGRLVQPALTYLANTLACSGREIPYSTVTAIDFADRPPLGRFSRPTENRCRRLGRTKSP